VNKVFASGAAGLILLSASAALPQEMPLPRKLQGALFKKILLYDRTLEGRDEIAVHVVPGSDSGAADEMAAALTDAGLRASVTRPGQLAAALESASVVYLMPGALNPGLQELCTSRKALSISGVPSWAEKGSVSISLDSADGKPVIVVNVRRARAEGHELSAQLLRLAKVVQ